MAIVRNSFTKIEPFNIFGDFLDGAWNHRVSGVKRYPLDIIESENEYTVKVSLPGINKGNLSVSIEKDVLTIEAKTSKEEKEEGTYLYQGIQISDYKRQISVEDYGIDTKKVSSKYKNGILTINLPKTKESKPKIIEVVVED